MIRVLAVGVCFVDCQQRSLRTSIILKSSCRFLNSVVFGIQTQQDLYVPECFF